MCNLFDAFNIPELNFPWTCYSMCFMHFLPRFLIKMLSWQVYSLERKIISEIPGDHAIIATGPLTSPELAQKILTSLQLGNYLSFFDAISPIIYKESIHLECLFCIESNMTIAKLLILCLCLHRYDCNMFPIYVCLIVS